MTTDRSLEYLASLVSELRKLPRDTEWVEFKVNDAEPQEIGEYLSALSNAAALCGKAFSYLGGVADGDHDLVTALAIAVLEQFTEVIEVLKPGAVVNPRGGIEYRFRRLFRWNPWALDRDGPIPKRYICAAIDSPGISSWGLLVSGRGEGGTLPPL